MNNYHQPRKRFGQHFLTDQQILKNIINAVALKKTDCVIEIGPGLGALTDYLLPHLNHLNVVEFDRDLIKILQHKYDSEKIKIYEADALTFSYASCGKDLRIIGNLPYNISTPLLFKLFSELDVIRDMHFMLQKEVVLRLTAEVGSEDYGRLSVMSQYFCDNDYLFTVPPTAFDPPPKVESAVVRLTPKKQMMLSAIEFEQFALVVKETFNYRRKTISNSLKRFVDIKTLESIDINPQLRPQDLTLVEFIRIGKAISVR